jgi:small subunit ribosomal protein S9
MNKVKTETTIKKVKVLSDKITKLNVGSRKTARAMVRITEPGAFVVNGKSYEEYFKEQRFLEDILRPMKALEMNIGFIARVNGGGISAQSWALRYALSKVLAGDNSELRKKLKVLGLLSGDARTVERKKVGRYKARAKFPFSRR